MGLGKIATVIFPTMPSKFAVNHGHAQETLHLRLKWFKTLLWQRLIKGKGWRGSISAPFHSQSPATRCMIEGHVIKVPRLWVEGDACHILINILSMDTSLIVFMFILSSLFRVARTNSKTKVIFIGMYWALGDYVGPKPENLVEKWIRTIILYNIYWAIITCQPLCSMPCMHNLTEFLQWPNEEDTHYRWRNWGLGIC